MNATLTKYRDYSTSEDLRDNDLKGDTAFEFIEGDIKTLASRKLTIAKTQYATGSYRKATSIESVVNALRTAIEELAEKDERSQVAPVSKAALFGIDINEGAERFMTEMELEQAVSIAVEISREVFSEIVGIRLELDKGEGIGDEHLRIFVESEMNDGKAEAYDKFYELLSQRLPRKQWGFIGLTF